MFHEAGMRKVRFREVKSLTHGHTAGGRQSQDSNPCLGVRSAHTHSGLCGLRGQGPELSWTEPETWKGPHRAQVELCPK